MPEYKITTNASIKETFFVWADSEEEARDMVELGDESSDDWECLDRDVIDIVENPPFIGGGPKKAK